jgi:hypothetical protein
LSFRLNQDVENAALSGTVYDQASEKPVSGVELVIENWLYEGGDYDGYGKSELYRKTTGTEGDFSINLAKSAFIVVYASKEGYVKDTVSRYANKSMKLAIELQKE